MQRPLHGHRPALPCAVTVTIGGIDPDEFVGVAITLVRTAAATASGSGASAPPLANVTLTSVGYTTNGQPASLRRQMRAERRAAAATDVLSMTVRIAAPSIAGGTAMVTSLRWALCEWECGKRRAAKAYVPYSRASHGPPRFLRTCSAVPAAALVVLAEQMRQYAPLVGAVTVTNVRVAVLVAKSS